MTGYVGINNHMGSRFTRSIAGMAVVMQELRRRGLLFLDSKTINDSVGDRMATEYGVPHVDRDIFLDNDMDSGAVDQMLLELERVARERGYAIGIGHPHPGTLDALMRWLPTLEARGFELVPISTIVRRVTPPTGQAAARMDKSQLTDIATAITEAGLAGRPEPVLLAELCARAVAAGTAARPRHGHRRYAAPDLRGARVPLARATRRRNHGHRIWPQRRGRGARALAQQHLLPAAADRRAARCCRRLTAETEAEFSIFAEAARGRHDRLSRDRDTASPPKGSSARWTASIPPGPRDAPAGFGDADIRDLQRLVPFLALAVKSASLARIAGTLVETYLGRDAGRRVLSGRIARGVADQIEAVLWFSDLRGYTRITDTAAPEQIIPLLNDYADAIISAIHEQGGEVLKLMGDGTLAIFAAADRGAGLPRRARRRRCAPRREIAALNGRRAAEGLPVTEMYLGLHVGEVFYGNIGSKDRLDFTVVGPAVNEVSRIAAMCRSVEQPMLLSAAFAAAVGEAGSGLVSVGRYALRGVGRPQDLFTIEVKELGRSRAHASLIDAAAIDADEAR